MGTKGVGKMGIGDRAKHLGQNLGGHAKEFAGRARRDKPLENEGKRDRRKSQLKTAGDHLKKAFKR
jgi:uncharacterized protein YjbJ (UPF0337 family)